MKIKYRSFISILILSSATALIAQEEKPPQSKEKTTNMLIDFTDKKAGHQMNVVNDGVMGGLSQGTIEMTQNDSLLFRGNISLQNNGGFSSFRIAGKLWDLSAWKGVEILVKGDGRTYGLRATTDETFLRSSVSFTADFKTVKDEWVKLQIPFSKMKASWRGRKLDRNFDPAQIKGLGIILADKQAGKFALEIKSISAWK
ncbi:CIA30 family protein [Akkermansiaceae bacterium]|nr:CIA30 family protein [Akkermansiaceae bacterium]